VFHDPDLSRQLRIGALRRNCPQQLLANHEQVHQSTGYKQPVRVLVSSSIAHLDESELQLHHREHVFLLGSDAASIRFFSRSTSSRSRSCIRKRVRPTVSAICQRRNDSVAGQPAGPQWTRFHRGPTASPILTARWRNLPRVAASPQLPACLRLRPSGVVRPRIRSAVCSTAIGNLPFPVQRTRAGVLRLQYLYPEFPALSLSPA
jgi:hypothetical protein